ncbi:MAG: Glu/Leu/Phe/Val dehydrogenase [bacterium]|nr:Glu/Leu/Phe/Val dehydrogenase [bacterium]
MEELKREGIVFDDIGPEYIIETYDPGLGFRGVLVIDNTNLGMAKGGIRMTGTVSTPEVFRLARAMSYKNALAGLPFGGGKAGIMVDPKTITPQKKKAIMESFAKSLRPLIPSQYIAGPDMNTTEKEMEIFARAHGMWESATGKPATYCSTKGGKKRCGLPHELGSTGFGVTLAAEVAAKARDIKMEGASVAIAGYGNVGVFAHKFLQGKGAKIIAVSDSSGTIYDRKGIDYETLLAVKTKTGSISGYPGVKKLSRDVIYELTCDILIPAATPDVINEKNVGRVMAKIIVEGANIPMQEQFEQMLHKKDVLIIPDIIANAGGVISSYAEYKGYDAKKMFKIVEEKIVPNVNEIIAKSEGTVIPRQAALKIARSRILAKAKSK